MSHLLTDARAFPGLRLRTFGGPGDYPGMAEASRAANLHDEEDFVPDATMIRIDLENTTDLDPARDVFIAEIDGQVVGWSNVFRQVRDGLAVYQTTGVVHPDWRRRGIGRSLLRTDEARIREIAEQRDDREGRAFGSWSGDRQHGANALLAAEGYVPVRYGFSMRRPTLDDIPDAALPEGLEIREVRREDLRTIVDADNEAFRDHWGHREQNDDDFNGMLAQPDLDTTLWSVAWDGDQVAGVVQSYIWRSENRTLGVERGWLEHISVRRPWRRRGVARAIIADALGRLKAAGMNEAMLGVDSENPTGALQLYESMGFATRDRGATWRKVWEPGGRLF
jgi:mycothiol synthase